MTGAMAVGLIAAPAAAKPGPTIVDTALAVNADSGEFTYLIQAVVKAGLVETLDGKRQFTVFPPLMLPSRTSSTSWRRWHRGHPASTSRPNALRRWVSASAVTSSISRVRTMSKSFLRPSIQGGDPYISGANNSAEIVLPDVDASNGVIHVIDAVLLP
jgi:uncharacterized surface protein with fasciclin (FAS1) repeats